MDKTKAQVILFPMPVDELLQMFRNIIREVQGTIPPKTNTESKIQFLSQAEACRRLQTTKPTIIRWVKEGRLKAYRAGRYVRFKESELEMAMKPVKTSK